LAFLSSDMVRGQMPRLFSHRPACRPPAAAPDGGRGDDSGHARNEFAGLAWCLR
jgi:hypothetical protein